MVQNSKIIKRGFLQNAYGFTSKKLLERIKNIRIEELYISEKVLCDTQLKNIDWFLWKYCLSSQSVINEDFSIVKGAYVNHHFYLFKVTILLSFINVNWYKKISQKGNSRPGIIAFRPVLGLLFNSKLTWCRSRNTIAGTFFRLVISFDIASS